MSALLETQRWLARIILDPGRLDADPAAASAPLTVDDPATAADRLHAYVDGYPARIREALEEAFPALRHVVGPKTFDVLATRYVPHVPDGEFDLGRTGRCLADFLRSDELSGRYAFLPDLALLEWRVHEAFHAREREPFDPSSAAAWTLDDWAAARVVFQPSVAVVRSFHPVLDIWDARETPVADIDIALEGRPQNVFVYRDGYRVVCEALLDAEAAALECLLAGRTLGETMEILAAGCGVPEVAPERLRAAASAALVVDCRAD